HQANCKRLPETLHPRNRRIGFVESPSVEPAQGGTRSPSASPRQNARPAHQFVPSAIRSNIVLGAPDPPLVEPAQGGTRSPSALPRQNARPAHQICAFGNPF